MSSFSAASEPEDISSIIQSKIENEVFDAGESLMIEQIANPEELSVRLPFICG